MGRSAILIAAMDASFDSADSLADQADAWIILLHSGRATPADRRRLAAWRSLSQDHEAAYRAAERLWEDLGAVPLGAAVAPPVARPRRRRPALAMAASLALALAMAMAQSMGVIDDWRSDFHTATGQRSEISLADGSRVALDTDSALAVDFDAAVRRITVLRGRAAFTVAKDAARPFEATAGEVTARALGTVFELARDDGRVRVSVVEHAVAARADAAEPVLRLAVGQSATWDGQHWLGPEAVDMRVGGAWRKGKLIFNDRPLREAIAELDRYLPGAVLIVGSDLQALRVTGVFPLEQPEAVLNDMAGTLRLKLVRLGPWLVVLHR